MTPKQQKNNEILTHTKKNEKKNFSLHLRNQHKNV